jgi:hypothetical protein
MPGGSALSPRFFCQVLSVPAVPLPLDWSWQSRPFTEDALDGEPVPADVVGEQLHRPLGVDVGHHGLALPPAPGGVVAGLGALDGQVRLGDLDGLVYSPGQTRMVRAFLTKPLDVKELLELLDAVAGERDRRQGVR